MEMRLARREDIPALSLVWQECFGDGRAYIDFFYRERFDSICVPILTDDAGKTVAMVHMLPCTLDNGESDTYGKTGHGTNAYYLYAVGASRAWRGKGAMRTLLTTIVNECERESVALALSPVNERLISYYESYGFRMTGGYYHGFFDRSELEGTADLTWQACDAAEYFSLRAAAMAGLAAPHMLFPIEGVAYALRENAYFGGCALCSSASDGALVQKEGTHLVVRELCLRGEDFSVLRAGLGALLDRFDAKSCEVRTNLAFSPKLQRVNALMTSVPMDFHGQSFAYANLLLD